MLVWVRRPRQVAVGAVILVGAVGGAAVVLGVGRRRWRRAVVLVRAGLDVAAVVFRHLRPLERAAWRLDFLISESRSYRCRMSYLSISDEGDTRSID